MRGKGAIRGYFYDMRKITLILTALIFSQISFGQIEIEERSIDGQTSSIEYIQRGDFRYSELSNNRSLTSMYRGVRLQISYYIF